jgi:hypothetical protein
LLELLRLKRATVYEDFACQILTAPLGTPTLQTPVMLIF